jgi:uncharacterized protein YgiM (DUF1202 family)
MVLEIRRRSWLWCLAVIFFGCLAGEACAQGRGAVATFPVEGEVVSDSVSIRPAGSRDSNRLMEAFKGDKLQVLGETGEWYRVQLPSDYAMWISKEFVPVGPEKERAITGDNVRSRAGAGLEYQMTGLLDRGRRIEVLDEKDGWLKFRFAANEVGFISRQYVRLAGEEAPRVNPAPPSVSVSPRPQPIETPVEPETDALQMFNRAEEAYQREVRKENIADWNLDEASALYNKVLEVTRNKMLISKTHSRLAVVALARRYQEQATAAANPRKVLEQREKEIDEQFAGKRKLLAEEMKRLFPNCIAVGRIVRLASNLQPATHKLIVDDRITNLLYSDSIHLSIYEGQTAGVEGAIDSSLKWPIPVIRVAGVVLSPKRTGQAEGEEAAPAPEKPAKKAAGETE